MEPSMLQYTGLNETKGRRGQKRLNEIGEGEGKSPFRHKGHTQPSLGLQEPSLLGNVQIIII